ncbi:MAG: SIMPL domain-containing protein [Planctomycetaceae bacterium]|nr:SIMPL domain-containing protein [Planctomycetaceae bacterium]
MKTTVIGAVLAIVLTGPAWSQQAQMYDDRPKITVTGEAVVNVKPDKIVISFGIETWDADITVAKQKNNDILKKSVAAVKECGIPEKDIQTDQLSIEPRWSDNYVKKNFIGYFVRNTVVVTLSEVGKVEDLVTSALQSGVNYIHGLDFQTTEFKEYREQARELALKAAKEKADKMSAVLGQTVGVPIQINENYSGSPWRYWSSWYGWDWGWGRSSGMSQVQVQADRGSSGEITDTVALGKLSIRANVSVTFELKK